MSLLSQQARFDETAENLANKFVTDKLKAIVKGGWIPEEEGEWICQWMGECFPSPDMEDSEWENLEEQFWIEVGAIIERLR